MKLDCKNVVFWGICMGILHKFVCVTLILCFTVSCTNEKEEKPNTVIRPVNLIEINLSDIEAYRFPGEVEASKRASLAFRVPGYITQYHVLSGQDVEKGQLLVELDQNDYHKRLDIEQANFDLATVQHKRAAALVKEFLISSQEYDKTASNLRVAEANLKTAKANLSYTKIYAPYKGRVAARYNEKYENVQAQMPVLSFQSDNAIDISVSLPERLIGTFKNIQDRLEKLAVSFSVAPGNEYNATVKEVSSVADEDTGSFEIILTLPSPKDFNLVPGMAASVALELNVAGNKKAIVIDDSAILSEDGNVYVWRYQPTTQTVEKVKIVLSSSNTLLSGLDNGDLIVGSGAKELTANQKVKPWVKERGL